MCVPAKVTRHSQPQVPGTADHLQDLTMQHVLCVKRGPGCSHPDDLALGGVTLYPTCFPKPAVCPGPL